MKRVTLLFLFLIITYNTYAQIDAAATCETEGLYTQLKNISGNMMLFGHQNTTLEGLNWTDNAGTTQQSDVVTSVGDYPAVVGFDFIRGYGVFYEHVKKTYERGGIVTMSDHMDNPKTGGDSWDVSDTTVVENILIYGSNENLIYKYYLQQSATFFNNVKVDGVSVPIIYRPLHENSGSWFWWGKNLCSADEYKQLFQFTVHYMRDTLNVHNLLYAYSPSQPTAYGDYDERYPGDAYVDIIGFDMYGSNDFSSSLVQNCKIVVEFANARNKVAALTEFGVSNGIQNTSLNSWFTSAFLNPIKNDPIAKQIAFALTWRNGDANHHWVPLPGDVTYLSFLNMYNDPYSGFQDDLPSNLYDCTVSTDNIILNQPTFKVFPNPTTEQVQIKFEEYTNATIHIYNELGQVLITEELNGTQATFDVETFKQGVYFIKIIHKNTTIQHQSFVKM